MCFKKKMNGIITCSNKLFKWRIRLAINKVSTPNNQLYNSIFILVHFRLFSFQLTIIASKYYPSTSYTSLVDSTIHLSFNPFGIFQKGKAMFSKEIKKKKKCFLLKQKLINQLPNVRLTRGFWDPQVNLGKNTFSILEKGKRRKKNYKIGWRNLCKWLEGERKQNKSQKKNKFLKSRSFFIIGRLWKLTSTLPKNTSSFLN